MYYSTERVDQLASESSPIACSRMETTSAEAGPPIGARSTEGHMRMAAALKVKLERVARGYGARRSHSGSGKSSAAPLSRLSRFIGVKMRGTLVLGGLAIGLVSLE